MEDSARHWHAQDDAEEPSMSATGQRADTKDLLSAVGAKELSVLRALEKSKPKDEIRLAVAAGLPIAEARDSANKLAALGLIERVSGDRGEEFQLNDEGLERYLSELADAADNEAQSIPPKRVAEPDVTQ
jgi:predicted transcriptional regulator